VETAAYVDDRLSSWRRGEAVPFAQVRRTDGQVVGVTCFLTPRHLVPGDFPYAVEIGSTWLAWSAQRRGINVEAKLLMFTHAFENWGVARVDLTTDVRNERSRAAIAALGATFEGVMRNWQPSFAAGESGRLRDTAMFSVVAADWPSVKAGLEGRLARN
jgi:RimJ/RimL family protein N-acetyltransferase